MAMRMIPKRNMKPLLELHGRNQVTLRESAMPESFSTDADLIVNMIEEGLDALGENVARVIMYHLEHNYSLKRNEIAQKADLFTKALRDIFGEGSLTIEKIIIETISREIGIGEMGTRNLSKAIEHIRKHLSYEDSGPQRVL